MRRMKKLIIYIIFLLLFTSLFGQKKGKSASPEELITISLDTPFPQAMKTLEIMSQKFEGKKVLNTSSFTGPIGLPINQVHWKNAFKLIANYNGLEVEELPGIYIIKDIKEEIQAATKETAGIKPDDKLIRISSIFFTANKNMLNTLGIDWSTITNGEVVSSANFLAGSKIEGEMFNAAISRRLSSGNIVFDVSALIKIIESNSIGKVIARPSMIVLSGKKGFFQVGKDFSLITKDFQGNSRQQFFNTGVIMDMTPTIITDSLREAIHLTVSIERSDAIPGEFSTTINKIKSTTELIFFDGEESVIAGLYDFDENKNRSGIPILRDLPWWVFGIRFLTGYEKVERTEREIVIILKAEIVDNIDDRLENNIGISKQKLDEFRQQGQDINNKLFNDKKIKLIKKSENIESSENLKEEPDSSIQDSLSVDSEELFLDEDLESE